MYIYIFTHMCIHMHIHDALEIHTHTHKHTRTHTHINTDIHTLAHTHTHTRTRTSHSPLPPPPPPPTHTEGMGGNESMAKTGQDIRKATQFWITPDRIAALIRYTVKATRNTHPTSIHNPVKRESNIEALITHCSDRPMKPRPLNPKP